MLASHAGGKISPSVRIVRPWILCLTRIQTHDLHVSFQQFEVLIHDQGVRRKVRIYLPSTGVIPAVYYLSLYDRDYYTIISAANICNFFMIKTYLCLRLPARATVQPAGVDV